MAPLSQKILTTLTYYDIMDYPMTAFELWKYLIRGQETGNSEQEKIKLSDIIKELEDEELRKKLEQCCGYYFLKGRKKIVEQRIENNKIAEHKFKKIRKIASIIKFIPFVRMVAVTGTLAMKNTQKSSDLDLLVALKHGHIFTGRSLVTLATHILGVRRYGQKIANRICLNFFITDKSLRINIQDLFSSSEYFFILPLFGYEIFKEFQRANDWIREFRENYIPEELANLKLIKDSFYAKAARKTGETILFPKFIEQKLARWQMKRIENDPRTHMNGSMVMADDNALIFLPSPQGPGVFEKFQSRLKELKI